MRRQGLLSHLCTLKTLLCQGVAIRGDNDLESNIYQFNLDKALKDNSLKLLLDDGCYTNSHNILQEQEQLLVLDARCTVWQTIRSNNFYAILADESSDVTKLEQLSFTVRSCDKHYTVKDFVGIFECSNGISADALITYITDVIKMQS